MKLSLDEILGDFAPSQEEVSVHPKRGVTLTIWVPEEAKLKYDRLQRVSRKKFGKKVREALLTLIDLAEKRAV